jgi:hypothetical protein
MLASRASARFDLDRGRFEKIEAIDFHDSTSPFTADMTIPIKRVVTPADADTGVGIRKIHNTSLLAVAGMQFIKRPKFFQFYIQINLKKYQKIPKKKYFYSF